MKNFQMIARAKGNMVVVILVCPECNDTVGKWTGMVGTVHIEVDDINGDIQDHVCEEG